MPMNACNFKFQMSEWRFICCEVEIEGGGDMQGHFWRAAAGSEADVQAKKLCRHCEGKNGSDKP